MTQNQTRKVVTLKGRNSPTGGCGVDEKRNAGQRYSWRFWSRGQAPALTPPRLAMLVFGEV